MNVEFLTSTKIPLACFPSKLLSDATDLQKVYLNVTVKTNKQTPQLLQGWES